MILYSKSGDFLGIGKDELSFLGYEDLDEFKSINNDVADLFVNKPGYIFKFKNFLWIDYALHSGAPKKSVILRLKTGNEAEVTLKIKELFLYSPKQEEDIYYSVEFINNISQNSNIQNESDFTVSKSAVKIPKKEEFEEKLIHKLEIPEEETIPEKILFEEDFMGDENDDVSINFDEPIEEKPSSFKLKIDNNSFKTEDVSIDNAPEKDVDTIITKDFVEDYKNDELPKLKVNIDTIKEVDFSNTLSKTKEDNIDFDIVQCVEKLGLDISLVGELITEYMEKIDKSIPIINKLLDESDIISIKNSIYQLKGISDNLYMYQISNNLEKILNAANIEMAKSALEKFEKNVEKFKEELL
jgi:hypothetical protein